VEVWSAWYLLYDPILPMLGMQLMRSSILFAEERKKSSENNVAGSDIAQVVEELLPSLPKRYVASSLNFTE